MKPQTRSIHCEDDLEKAVAGDLIKVDLGGEIPKWKVFYQTEEKDAFIEREDGKERIFSWESERSRLMFGGGHVVFNPLYRTLQVYNPSQEGYLERKHALVRANIW